LAYGGRWTLIKLEVLEKYLGFYVTALKDKFKLCYIDAFAGQGEFEVKNIGITTGSALRAMDYNFNQYIFIEKEIENNGKIEQKNREAITRLLGTAEWEDEIYYDSLQIGLFDDPAEKIRMNIDKLSKYIVKRLETVFPAVAQKPLKLTNPKNNSPLFLLCFAVSNPNPQAIKLSLREADHILTHTFHF
jgi:hypothetical protein